VNQINPFSPETIPFGISFAVGVSNSVITPCDKFPILPVPCSANQMPVLLKVSSNGLAPDVGIRNSRNVLVAVVNSPI
jgi:hypothetical protein